VEERDFGTASASPCNMLGTLDFCLPSAAPNERPALIINIHGGAFVFGDKAMEARNIAAQQAAGYAAAHPQPRSTGDLWSRWRVVTGEYPSEQGEYDLSRVVFIRKEGHPLNAPRSPTEATRSSSRSSPT